MTFKRIGDCLESARSELVFVDDSLLEALLYIYSRSNHIRIAI